MKAAANKLSEVGSEIEMVAARPGSLLVKPKTSVPTFHALAPLCEKLLLAERQECLVTERCSDPG